MADASAFGRRIAGTDSSAPASIPGKIDQTCEEEHAGLGRQSNLLSLLAQGSAFIAFMLLFAAACARPSDPTDLRILDGSIYVLDGFTNALGLSGVKSTNSSVQTGLWTLPYLSQYVSAILVLATAGTIIKGRWFFTGLAVVFFLIRWGMFGRAELLAPFGFALFAFIALVFHAPLSRPAIIAIIAVGIPGTPIVGGLMYDLPRHFSARPTYEKYRVIRPSDLPANVYQAAADANRDHRAQPDGNDGNEKIVPYFLAQAAAFRGNSAAAAAALDKLETSGFLLNNFDQTRFQAIRNFALASGGFGPQAREKFLADNAAQSQKAYLLLSAALIFAIAAPLTNGLGWWVARRSRRVLSIERELQQRRANLQGAVKRAAGVFGSRSANKLPKPSSIANGEHAIDAIASRARGYFLLILGLLAFAGLSAFGAYWIWLPEAADNTAFHFVALAGSTADYAQQNGVTVRAGADDWTAGPILLNWLKYPICLAAIVLATRRLRYLGALTTMAFVAFFTIDDFRFAQHSLREALPQQFSQGLRSKLDLAAGRPNGGLIALPQPVTDSVGGLDVNLRGSIAAESKSPSPVPPMEIDASLAAYTLAQIAYLEGNVVDTAKFLNQVSEMKVLYAGVHGERLALMRDWVSANGYTANAMDWLNADFPSLVRRLGRWLLALSIGSLGLAMLVTPLVAIAVARRRRIEALLEERGRYQL
ncbi:hypothetical protein [Rhizobium sp. M1]|uniref:hypothetical protein n=1 Tax=Rhizobium sp. M1 TaxID=2035453 RepID=UPI000BE99C85|nr:hypothetical protein [Rhizobium sp. M1]PDT12913.1 hypothetical protein CO655_03275 [Rhizobium sp. M1]